MFPLRSCATSESNINDAVDRFQDYAHMITLVNLLCQVIRRTIPVRAESASGNVIQDVLTYINNHYTQDLSITDLARHFGISESWLAHEFVRFTNRSVYNYILYRRVMLSRRLMLGEDSLNTIAYQCGFSDYSGFLRAFTKIAGISPSQYRKNLSQYQRHEL